MSLTANRRGLGCRRRVACAGLGGRSLSPSTAPRPPRFGVARCAVVGLFVVSCFFGCGSCDRAAVVVDAGPGEELLSVLTPEQEKNAVALVQARVPRRAGACAQIKSMKDKAEAEAVAAAIRKELNVDVELMEKDLGARGVWSRLCVGNEESPARMTAKAVRWVAPGGALERFLDPPTPNEPRFFVYPKATATAQAPTEKQARALLQRSSTGPAVFFGTAARPLLAATSDPRAPRGGAPGGHVVVVVDPDGGVLELDPAPPPGCASCAVAEQKSPITARRVIAAGDLLRDGPSEGPGDELLIEEETADGTRFVGVLVAERNTLRRKGAVLLSAASTGIVLRGEASVVEADADDDREVAIARLELRTDDKGNLCALDTRAEAWGTSPSQTVGAARGLVKLDVLALAQKPEGDDAVVDFVTALDGAGDPASASRACARVLAERPGTLVTQLCLQRVRTLVAEKRLIDAVNAAGALAEGTPALRAAVASPFFQAMSALDADVRLSAAPWDCAREPLVKDMPTKSLDDVIAQARARQQERVGLADVDDAVFVTATRDFGPDTPVGQIAARWLERLRVAQPARHAAIEALLLPPPPEPEVRDAGPANEQGGGFGGTP